MTKPVCDSCQRFFRIKRTGARCVEGMPIGDRVPPGTAAPEQWKPYKLWMADLWRCEGCGTEILCGFGRLPISIQHEFDFADKVARSNSVVQVNDC